MEYKRIDGKTPMGGDYSEIWYLDEQGEVVEEERATKCIVRECLEDGTVIASTRGNIRHGSQSNR